MKILVYLILFASCSDPNSDPNTGTDIGRCCNDDTYKCTLEHYECDPANPFLGEAVCKESYDGELENYVQFTCVDKDGTMEKEREVCCPNLERWKRCCAEQHDVEWKKRCQGGLYQESYHSSPCLADTNSDQTNIEAIKKKQLYYDCCTDFGRPDIENKTME